MSTISIVRPVLIASTMSATMLTSCSSGSSNADAAIPETIITADIELNADNALAATKTALRGAFDMQRLAYIATNFLRTQKPEPPEEEEQTTPSVLPATLTTELFAAQGGSALFTWNDADGSDSYTTNDVFTITCDGYVRDGLTLDGTILIDDFVVSGSLPVDGAWVVTATVQFINLDVTVGSQQTTFNLDLPVFYENRILVELFETTLPEDVFFGPLELKQGNVMRRFESDENFGLQFQGAVYSAELDGTLTYETPGTLGGFPFFPDPSTGVLEVRGANNSRLELEMGFFSLNIHVDADGDEDFEETIPASFFMFVP